MDSPRRPSSPRPGVIEDQEVRVASRQAHGARSGLEAAIGEGQVDIAEAQIGEHLPLAHEQMEVLDGLLGD
jgi:hypothetical protein